MKGLIFILYSVAIFAIGKGDRPELNISNVKSDLLRNANSVVRYHSLNHEIKSLAKRITKVVKTTSILNEEGIGSGKLVVSYTDGSEKVKGIKIVIFDKEGKKVLQVDKDDISDLSNSYGSLASTSRYKFYEYKANSYPFTIHLEYTLHSSNTLDLDSWWPVTYNQSVEYSEYSISSNDDFPFLSKIVNLDDRKLFMDSLSNQYILREYPAIAYESMSPHYKYKLPHMMVCPKTFQFEGVDGHVNDWSDFGKWFYELNDTQDEITSKMILDLGEIIDDNDDMETKAHKIYSYVKRNMRYVSIQLGIGGFQPFAAEEVHELKYGDCKGLSNYTKTLLNYYGIEALYTVIESNSYYNDDFDKEMPDLYQGNHIIICLPEIGDTTYLECTTKDLPFGYISSSNHNRNVLLVTKDGGKIVKTTKYDDRENLIEDTINIECDESFNAKLRRKIHYKNIALDNQRWKVGLNTKEQKKMISEHALREVHKYNLISYNIDQSKSEPLITEKYQVEIPNISKSVSNYVMLPLNMLAVDIDSNLEKIRSSEIYIKDGSKQKILINYTIPLGYTLVTDDTSYSMSNHIGSVDYEIEMTSDTMITVVAEVQESSGTYSAILAKEYNEFQESKRKLLRTNIVLKSKS